MFGGVAGLFDRVRRPASTGANRCLPCTAINASLAVSAAAVLATVRVGLAVAVLVASAAMIGLRGYLVPFTPAITARVLPARVRDLLKRASPPETARETLALAAGDGVDPASVLRAAGAVEAAPDGDLRATEGFAAEVRSQTPDRIESDPEASAVPPTALAELLDAGTATVERAAPPRVRADAESVPWRSTAALATDAAADASLAARSDRWRDLPRERRLAILVALRAALPDCPVCGSPLETAVHDTEDCCRSSVLATDCGNCGRLLVADPLADGVRTPAADPTVSGAGAP